jgi:hypothetical protein
VSHRLQPLRPTAQERYEPLVQTLVLVVLFAAPALFCVHAACIADPDIWWHLRTGEWITQHRAVPRADPFSSTAGGHPWIAYSWLFELFTFKLFTAFGLTGIVAYSAGMVLAITAAMHHLVRKLQRDFTFTILITYAAVFSLGHLFTPRPWLFTILLFIIEVDVLMQARRTGSRFDLYLLPILFAAWANLHIQFVDGLLVLLIAWAESFYVRAQKEPVSRLKPIDLGIVFFACAGATCLNPYGWHIFQVAHDLASQSGVLDKIVELQAIPFRSLVDFSVLLLALGAAAFLARSPRFLPFETVLFLFAAYVSFKSQRDVWVMATAAAAILGQGLPGSEKALDRTPFLAAPSAVLAASLAICLGFLTMKVNQATLADSLAHNMPVQALEAIKREGYTGPVWNDFTWGGFLIWQLRQPVSIDGRAALHGDERIDRSVATISGEPDWASDPQLNRAGLVILPVKAPLVQLLRFDQRFRLVFEDKVAAVFVARQPAQLTASLR